MTDDLIEYSKALNATIEDWLAKNGVPVPEPVPAEEEK